MEAAGARLYCCPATPTPESPRQHDERNHVRFTVPVAAGTGAYARTNLFVNNLRRRQHLPRFSVDRLKVQMAPVHPVRSETAAHLLRPGRLDRFRDAPPFDGPDIAECSGLQVFRKVM